MADDEVFMPIGRFSSMTRLSVRMLRHYDAHGVLTPAAVAPFTGYRHYTPAQLADAADVRLLRDLGFSVAEIRALMPARGTPRWAQALEDHRRALESDLAAATERLGLLQAVLDGDRSAPIRVVRRTVPPMIVVALRGTVDSYAHESRLWQRLMPLLDAQGITATGPAGVIEHDDEFTEHDVDLSVFVPVAPGTRTEHPLEVITIPARECLVAHVTGPYDRITRAHDLLNAHLVATGLHPSTGDTVAAKTFNLYLDAPDDVPATALRTLVHQPIAD